MRFQGKQHFYKGAASAAMVAVASLHAAPAGADYKPTQPLETMALGDWLVDQGKMQAESGAKSIGSQILSTVGSALLNAYMPGLADLFFGGGESEAQVQFKMLVQRLDDLELHLGQDLADLMDEVQDQLQVDIRTKMRAADERLIPFAAQTTLYGQSTEAQRVCDSANDYREIRIKVEEYIKTRSTNSAAQLRRLGLLPFQITATQLAATTSALCKGLETINNEFRATGMSGDRFASWTENLSRADIAAMEQRNPGANEWVTEIRSSTLAFYEELTSLDYVDAYLNDTTTPAVFQSNTFNQPIANFNNPSVVTNAGSWVPATDAVPILDGVRWFYYADIPQAECLDHPAWEDLGVHDTTPWREVQDDPSASSCNRFWIVDLNTHAEPSYLASFDDYTIWFKDPGDLQARHRDLHKGDVIAQIYGAASLILDRIHYQLHGQLRPKNAWDTALLERERIMGQLGVADDWSSNTYIERIRELDQSLNWCGLSFDKAGVEPWFALLQQSVNEGSTSNACALVAADDDSDGFNNALEIYALHTDPNNADSDGDGNADFLEMVFYYTDPTRADTDGDGVNDPQEATAGTNANSWDSDRDTLSDGDEANLGTNPLNADSDGDNIDDDRELARGSDPLTPA